MAKKLIRRHPMLSWWIGFAIVLAAVIYVGYRLACVECGPASIFPEFLVLAIVPAVYLFLMYTLFRGQADEEASTEDEYDPR